MTIDKLALAIQKDFDVVHAEMIEMKTTMGGMATKDELRSFKDEVLAAIADLRKVTEGINAHFSAYAVRTNEDISKLQGANKDFDVRLRVVEERG
jgi:hypothetical protein